MERVSAVLDADIEQGEREQRNVRIPVVDVACDHGASFTGSRTLLAINQIGDF